MEMLAPFIAYAAALAIAAAIPGPGVAALVGQSLGSGFRHGLFFIAGIAMGDLVYLTIAVAGLAALAKTMAGAILVVKVLGGVYLIYLATKFWTDRAGLSRMDASAPPQSALGSCLGGFMVTLGNPKAIIFYLALMPTVLDLQAISVSDWLTLAALTIAVLFVTLTPYAFIAGRAGRLVWRSGTLRRLNRFAALIIGGAGATILGQVAISLFRRA
ncbi:LysE family translocator [Parvularcula sp. LCG005]|uniref:LysE family translocator n=1 Tax=Parvularcula sp. LCG005 TaxID=3078805 RepID=UPI002943DA8F|nr:LysE family translocator [Parvularcula sp. LCG005]WOI54101.1 LysE family translocator [Parvularcula sp. LCG005]